jgi:hypothetical protein
MTDLSRRPAARRRALRSRLPFAVLLTALALPVAAAAADPPSTARLETGFEERVRSENWDNSTDFDATVVDARHQWRFRTRLWAKLTLGGHTDLAVGLANESRTWTTPRLALTLDETVFETLYFEHRFADGASLRVGRQNLARGDGFILMDGGPLDGSRTAYFNALVASQVSGPSRLDFLVVSDPCRDRYLPPLHDRHRPLIEWDETALGLYWTGPTPCRAGTADLYGFVKTEGDERLVPTLGGRVVRGSSGRWTAKAELAAQAPRAPGADQALAWGGQASVRRTFACAMKPSLLLGWTGLSGDDPATEADEGWDPLFSRWPRWSDLYIYTLASERGAAYWTNLSMWQAEFRATPRERLDLRLGYQRLDAFHGFPGAPEIYGGGTRRGDLYAGRVDYRLNDAWRGHVVGEWFEPGDFYAHGDGGWFFRVELTCGFQRAFGLTAL